MKKTKISNRIYGKLGSFALSDGGYAFYFEEDDVTKIATPTRELISGEILALCSIRRGGDLYP